MWYVVEQYYGFVECQVVFVDWFQCMCGFQLVGIDQQFGVVLVDVVYVCVEYDVVIMDEYDVVEDVFDFFYLMGGDDDGFLFVEIVFQQVLVEFFVIEDVQVESGFVQYQDVGVDGYYQCQVQLYDYVFGQFVYVLFWLQFGIGQEVFVVGVVEVWVDVGDEVDCFVYFQLVWQYGDVGDEVDVIYQCVVMQLWILVEYVQVVFY